MSLIFLIFDAFFPRLDDRLADNIERIHEHIQELKGTTSITSALANQILE